MGDNVRRFLIPAAIGFAPLILFLMTWQANRMGVTMLVVRSLTLPVLAAEIATIVVAVSEGMIASWKTLRPPKFILAALAILLATAIATALFVAPQKVSLALTLYWVIHLLFGLSVAFLAQWLFRASDLVDAYLAGFILLVVAFAVFAASPHSSAFRWTWDLPGFSHIRHFGYYATGMVGLCLGVMATAKPGWRWGAAFVVAVSGLAASLWTGSRGTVFALAGAVVIGVIAMPAMRRPKAWGAAILCLLLGFATVVMLPAPADNMGALRTVSATQGSDVLTGRHVMWEIVLEAIAKRPVFGYGEGQMKAVATYYGMAQPHNIVLQILLAWGIAGLLCCLSLGIWFAWRAIPEVRADQDELLPPFMAMAALASLSVIDAGLYYILPVSIFAACAGLIAAGWSVRTPRT